MRTVAVIGKNFGDEGKGLVTASLCLLYKNPLVVKHNGGAQAGHTVENKEKGTRFIHHQIGSGAEYGADTLFADTFHPDLFQIEKEMEEFKSLFGFYPKLFGEPAAKITTIDDVLLNMAIETKRGEARHGSCGMGINECVERIKAGYAITLEEIKSSNYDQLVKKLSKIREVYSLPRAKELGLDNENTYWEMLTNPNTLLNFAEAILKNVSQIQIVDANKEWLKQYDGVIFENGQGLLLDEDYLVFAPHLTSSKTGVAEPVSFLNKRNMDLQEAIYVSRTYVTRHGAGPLLNEFERTDYPGIEKDMTNEQNEWQGRIRYAKHESIQNFMGPVLSDVKEIGIKPSLAITHINETDGKILFKDKDIPLDVFISEIKDQFENIYLSGDRQNLQK